MYTVHYASFYRDRVAAFDTLGEVFTFVRVTDARDEASIREVRRDGELLYTQAQVDEFLMHGFPVELPDEYPDD